MPDWDRRISGALMEQLTSGVLRELNQRVRATQHGDLQLRRATRNPSHPWATFYVGLTKVLDIHEERGRYRFDAHPTSRRIGQFDESWRRGVDAVSLATTWPLVQEYLDRILEPGVIGARYLREGRCTLP